MPIKTALQNDGLVLNIIIIMVGYILLKTWPFLEKICTGSQNMNDKPSPSLKYKIK